MRAAILSIFVLSTTLKEFTWDEENASSLTTNRDKGKKPVTEESSSVKKKEDEAKKLLDTCLKLLNNDMELVNRMNNDDIYRKVIQGRAYETIIQKLDPEISNLTSIKKRVNEIRNKRLKLIQVFKSSKNGTGPSDTENRTVERSYNLVLR